MIINLIFIIKPVTLEKKVKLVEYIKTTEHKSKQLKRGWGIRQDKLKEEKYEF